MIMSRWILVPAAFTLSACGAAGEMPEGLGEDVAIDQGAVILNPDTGEMDAGSDAVDGSATSTTDGHVDVEHVPDAGPSDVDANVDADVALDAGSIDVDAHTELALDAGSMDVDAHTELALDAGSMDVDANTDLALDAGSMDVDANTEVDIGTDLTNGAHVEGSLDVDLSADDGDSGNLDLGIDLGLVGLGESP
jgi:hypothetical protein